MDKDYPLYVRYRLRGSDIDVSECPGVDCSGHLDKDSSLLGSSSWECDTCGVVYDAGDSDKDGMARADTDSVSGSFDSWMEFRKGQYVEIK